MSLGALFVVFDVIKRLEAATMVATCKHTIKVTGCPRNSTHCARHSDLLHFLRVQPLKPSKLARHIVRLLPRLYLHTQDLQLHPIRFLLATCTFTPLYGRLCNVLGRRGANQTAVLLAAVGTLACGLSNSLEMLIAARFVRHLLKPDSSAHLPSHFQLT